jgi:hypothetical protein
MTLEQVEIAKRMAAHRRWVWVGGMLALGVSIRDA